MVFTFPVALSLFIIFLVLYLLHNIIIKPYLAILFYKSQGLKHSKFYPIMGIFYYFRLWFEKYDDNLFGIRELPQKEQKIRALVSNFGSQPVLVLGDPALKREYFINNQQNWERYKPKMNVFTPMFGKQNIISSEEHNGWKRSRTIISKAFNFNFLKSIIPIVANTSFNVFNNLINKEQLKLVDIISNMQRITANSLLESFFGTDIQNQLFEGQEISVAIKDLMAQMAKERYSTFFLLFRIMLSQYNILPEHRRLNSKIKRFRSMMNDFIHDQHDTWQASKNASGKSDDASNPMNLLHILFEYAEKSNQNSEESFALPEILNEFLTLYAAGTESTTHMMSHTIYYLTQYPEVHKKLMKEVDENIKTKEDLTWDKVQGLKYLNACLKETLRLSTVAPLLLMREAINDHNLGDIKIQKGTLMYLGFLFSCSYPEYFENPNEYNPDRWLPKEGVIGIEEKEPFVFIPFSSGKRNCVGQHFSLMEAKIVLPIFLKTFNFTLQEGYKMRWIYKFSYGPDQPILCNLQVKDRSLIA